LAAPGAVNKKVVSKTVATSLDVSMEGGNGAHMLARAERPCQAEFQFQKAVMVPGASVSSLVS